MRTRSASFQILPTSFIIRQSAYHSTLYSLRYWWSPKMNHKKDIYIETLPQNALNNDKHNNWRRDSVVGITTGYGLDDRRVGVGVPVQSRIPLFSTSFRPALGITQPPIQWVPGVISPGVKRRGHEANHSPPPRAEVKKIWIYTSTPPYAFMA
jgi:hypothetical protein